MERIIKLKKYDGYPADYAGLPGIVFGEVDEALRFKFVGSDAKWVAQKGNFVEFQTVKISEAFDKLKVGDLVVTNGDGSNAMEDMWIYGYIGEIEKNTAGKDDKFFLWNNQRDGSHGKLPYKALGYKFSWLIRAKNKNAVIAVVNMKKKKKKIVGTAVVCSHCNEEFSKDDILVFGDKNYCMDCHKLLVVKCDNCDEMILKTDQSTRQMQSGEYWCDDCYQDNGCKCHECGEYIENDDSFSSADGDVYCEDCYSDIFTHCTACSEEISTDDAHYGDDEPYCEDCFWERYSRCSQCGRTMSIDDGCYDEENDETYCEDCHQGRRSKVIHDYGYRPEPELRKEAWDPENALHLGFEVEVSHDEYGDLSEQLVSFLDEHKVKDRYYLKHDSSVASGFEIVSQPATLKWIMKNQKVREMFEWLSKEDFGNDGCGIHVHMSRNFFEELDISKMRVFFIQNKKQMDIFSQRDGDLHYCQIENKNPKEILQGAGQDDRYWAVNTNSSRETVEIRIFKSTVNIKTFIGFLEFTDALARFVKVIGITSLIYGEGKYRNNSWGLFIDWAKETGKYKTMLERFDVLKIS